MDKKLLILASYSYGYQGHYTTLIPTMIPIKLLDALGFCWTWGTRFAFKKQERQGFFVPWRSS